MKEEVAEPNCSEKDTNYRNFLIGFSKHGIWGASSLPKKSLVCWAKYSIANYALKAFNKFVDDWQIIFLNSVNLNANLITKNPMIEKQSFLRIINL